MRTHDACTLFPMIGDDEFAALKADIKEHGQKQPILTTNGVVVDGRNRLRACTELGIEPVFEEVKAADVFALVMSLNFHRRHLRPHEKGASLAAYMERVGAKKQQGKRTDKAKGGTSATLAEVADKLGVPEATARFQLKAAEDYKAAAPEQRAKVDAGDLTPKQARAATEKAAAPVKDDHDPMLDDPMTVMTLRFNKFRDWLGSFIAENPRFHGRAHTLIKTLSARVDNAS